MALIRSNPDPKFDVTRISHCVLTSADLDKTRYFYETAIGLQVTDQDENTLYMRGMDETCHHSLVFVKSEDGPSCMRMGYRMYHDDDLKRAHDHFNALGNTAEFVERPFQGLTLHVNDGVGVPLEFCAKMDQSPSLMQKFHTHSGGKPGGLDHAQIACHDVQGAYQWYADIGFRLSEYTAKDGTDEMWGVWLKRKNNTQDIVFGNGQGPRLHHFAYQVPDAGCIIHAADVMASLGLAETMDRGPGRHGIGNALFVYFRDPDGHRIELFTNHYPFIDSDMVPLRWELSDTSRSQLWGLPATKRWFFEATEFNNVAVKDPLLEASPVTLEAYLENM